MKEHDLYNKADVDSDSALNTLRPWAKYLPTYTSVFPSSIKWK